MPTHLRVCFMEVTKLPTVAEWSVALVTEVLGKLRKSELDKTDCGRQLLRFIDDVSAGRSAS